MTTASTWPRTGMALGVALLLALSGLAYASCVLADYQTGLDAYQHEDFEKAYYEWIKVAVSKDGEAHPADRAESQYALGMLYWLGQGVEQDTAAAAVWLREAAELDHAGAQSKLGYLYLSGAGVPHNDFEALKWLQMAAYKNDADAQYNLGVMYRDGMGVDPDPGQSMYWFRQAADNGDPVSAGIVAGGVFMDPGFDQTTSTNSTELSSEPSAATDTTGNTVETGAADPVADDTMPEPVQPPLPVLAETADSVEPEQAELPPLDEAAEFTQERTPGENWIRQRSPEHYTIQVIALQNLDKLQMFIGQHPDWAPFAIYQQTFKGKPIYVLVQGDYADVRQAQDAVRMFPPGFQKREELWIRRFIMVQGLLP